MPRLPAARARSRTSSRPPARDAPRTCSRSTLRLRPRVRRRRAVALRPQARLLRVAPPTSSRKCSSRNHRNSPSTSPGMNQTLLGNGLLTAEGDFWLRQRGWRSRRSTATASPPTPASWSSTPSAWRVVASTRGGGDLHRTCSGLTLEDHLQDAVQSPTSAIKAQAVLEALLRRQMGLLH